MKYHPITFNGVDTDTRYAIAKEFCGQSEPRFVARFCGAWIGQSKFYVSAVMLAAGHSCARRGCAVILSSN